GWQEGGKTPAGRVQANEHHVILCDFPRATSRKLKTLLPHGHCVPLQAGPHQTIAERYSDHALACFERIQTILQAKPAGKVFVQILVAEQDPTLLARVSALPTTAPL